MDRKQWLTMVYREANLFLERNAPENAGAVEDLEPELHEQLQEVLKTTDQLEDIVKHSLLRHPAPDLWYGESEWQHVLAAVASACLLHDVKGVALKILEGKLPRTASDTLLDAL